GVAKRVLFAPFTESRHRTARYLDGGPFMFLFAHPAYLLLLPLVPFVLWRWHHAAAGGMRYSATTILARLPEGRSRRARIWGLGLRGAALLLLVLALAGPRWPDQGSRVPTEGIAIAMVVDVS